MSISRRMEASEINRPRRRRVPQAISTTPTKGAENCGQGIPIFAKRPVPKAAGKRNFWMPSERKTQPTRMRTSRMLQERRREEPCGSLGSMNLHANSKKATFFQKRSTTRGNVSNRLRPSSARATALIRPTATVLFRQRHSKIPHARSQMRTAVVVTPESGPVGLLESKDRVP
jgi:hypothetical protein